MQYSIIQKSQLEGVQRLDAEYYQPEFLETKNRLLSVPHFVLGDHAFITDGEHGSAEFVNDGIKFLTAENIQEGFINNSGVRFVSEEVDKRNKRASLLTKDIVISIKGTVGLAGIAFNDDLPANMNRDVSRIHVKNKINPYYLVAFLNSKLGKNQTLRESSGNVQQMTTLGRLRELLIPKVPDSFSSKIEQFINDSRNALNDSQNLYQQAENFLLVESGLADFKPKGDLSFVVNLSDVKSANRIDADYFQPKYEKLVAKIKSRNEKRLEEFVASYSTGFPYKSENYQEDGTPLIRINNIKKGFIDLNDTAYLSERDYSLSPKDTARPGDIVLSMSGTIGMSAVIPGDVPKCSVNQRILKFSPKDIDPDLLVLILNSVIGGYQLERIGTGGVQTNISYKDIQNILIPVLPKGTQQKIADLVIKSHEARKKSKELLEEAKRKVEEMIEKGNTES